MTDHFRIGKLSTDGEARDWEVYSGDGRLIEGALSYESAKHRCAYLNFGFAAGVEHERREQRERARA